MQDDTERNGFAVNICLNGNDVANAQQRYEALLTEMTTKRGQIIRGEVAPPQSGFSFAQLLNAAKRLWR